MIADEFNFFEGETGAVRSTNNGAVMISQPVLKVNEGIENPDPFKGVPGNHVLVSIHLAFYYYYPHPHRLAAAMSPSASAPLLSTGSSSSSSAAPSTLLWVH